MNQINKEKFRKSSTKGKQKSNGKGYLLLVPFALLFFILGSTMRVVSTSVRNVIPEEGRKLENVEFIKDNAIFSDFFSIIDTADYSIYPIILSVLLVVIAVIIFIVKKRRRSLDKNKK